MIWRGGARYYSYKPHLNIGLFLTPPYILRSRGNQSSCVQKLFSIIINIRFIILVTSLILLFAHIPYFTIIKCIINITLKCSPIIHICVCVCVFSGPVIILMIPSIWFPWFLRFLRFMGSPYVVMVVRTYIYVCP